MRSYLRSSLDLSLIITAMYESEEKNVKHFYCKLHVAWYREGRANPFIKGRYTN